MLDLRKWGALLLRSHLEPPKGGYPREGSLLNVYLVTQVWDPGLGPSLRTWKGKERNILFVLTSCCYFHVLVTELSKSQVPNPFYS